MRHPEDVGKSKSSAPPPRRPTGRVHARPGGTYLQVEVRSDSVTPTKKAKPRRKAKKGKGKGARPSGVHARKPSIQNLQARRPSSSQNEIDLTKPDDARAARSIDRAIRPPEMHSEEVAALDGDNLAHQGVLRPLGAVTTTGSLAEKMEIVDADDEDIESLEYDDEDFYEDDEDFDEEAEDDAESARTMEDFGAEAEDIEDDDEPITAVKKLKRRLSQSLPVARLSESPQLNQLRESVTAVTKSRSLRLAIPNFQQLRTSTGIASVTALTISMAVAYYVPTSVYGLETLLKIASAAMGLSVLSLPVKAQPLRLLERWLLAVCAAAVVYYGDPVSVLAEEGAEGRIADSDAQVRANGVRTLAALGRKDFSGLNLQGADLSGLDLGFSSFEGTNLIGADLSYVKFTRARLDRARMNGADLNGADMFGASAHLATGFDEASCTFRTKLPTDFVCQRGKPIPRPR